MGLPTIDERSGSAARFTAIGGIADLGGDAPVSKSDTDVAGRETHAREDAAFEHLCAVLSEYDGRPVRVISRPDREGVAGGCDAILARGSLRVAAEHTCVYSVVQRRRLPLIWQRIALLAIH